MATASFLSPCRSHRWNYNCDPAWYPLEKAVSNCWLIKTDREHVRQIAALRHLPGLQVAEANETIWVRAAAGDETLDRVLKSLPGKRFQLLDDVQLAPWGKQVPTERLPRLAWQPIANWSAITLPVAAMPASVSKRVRLRMIRGGTAKLAAALLVDWQDWLKYAIGAPEVRLRPLVFALSAPHETVSGMDMGAAQRSEDGLPSRYDQRAFIVGSPLPPLAGYPYTLDDGLAVPCGWTFSPAVGSAVVRKLIALPADDMALFDIDGSFERIVGEHFVRASRSAARESARGETCV